jgi:hypothetical protein
VNADISIKILYRLPRKLNTTYDYYYSVHELRRLSEVVVPVVVHTLRLRVSQSVVRACEDYSLEEPAGRPKRDLPVLSVQ